MLRLKGQGLIKIICTISFKTFLSETRFAGVGVFNCELCGGKIQFCTMADYYLSIVVLPTNAFA